MFRGIVRTLTFALVALSTSALFAQGVLVVVHPDHPIRLPRPIIIRPPRPTPPPAQYQIKSLEMQARLVDQVAQVQVSQTFENTGSRQLEVCFVFPLPYDGAIDQMTLMVDGKEYPAELLDAEKAQQMYEDIVRKNKDPALLQWMGTGLFKTNVFPVPAGAKRTVSLRYSQICRKQDGLTDFLYPMSTARYTSDAVEQIKLRLTIESQEEIKNVYSPTHAVKIKRPDDHHAVVTYEAKKEIPSSDFRLLYDVGRGKVGAKVLSYRPDKDKNGYFLLLASPKIKAPDKQPPKKTVVFVVDRSGSMSGKKIEQARGALKFVLNNLRKGDLFNIVAYDSEVSTFRPELQRFDEKTRKAAVGFVEGVFAGGSTNINGALKAALSQLRDSDRPSYVVFLTDGLPTAGETNEMKIVENACEVNRVRARIFAFGVGYDVNSRLLDRLVRENYGQSEYVRPDEDIEARVSSLYNRIQSPVMTDVGIAFEFDDAETEHGKPVNRVYPSGSFDLFAGEQLVVVGRYRKHGKPKVLVSGTVDGKQQKLTFPARLVKKSDDETNAFIEKIWAMRRVGEILDELDLKGENDELVEELIRLATKHGILTPYTSFLADEETKLEDVAANARRANRRLGALQQSGGRGGFVQRKLKGQFQRADQAAPAAPMEAEAFGAFTPPAPGRIAAGVGGGRQQAASAAPANAAPVADAAKELKAAEQNLRHVGNRAFYRRDGRWVDASVEEIEEERIEHVEQFSDEYFELARQYGRKLTQYLVFDEPVLLEVEGQLYQIEP